MAISTCAIKTDGDGREISAHGAAAFPVACYDDDLAAQSVPWHWHDEMEAILVTEGRAVIAAGTQKFTICAGGGAFVNAGVLHAVWHAPGSACRLRSAVFHPRLVGGEDSVFWQRYVAPLLQDASLTAAALGRDGAWQGKRSIASKQPGRR